MAEAFVHSRELEADARAVNTSDNGKGEVNVQSEEIAIGVIIDEVGEEGATGRSQADAPEIDGQVFLRDAAHLSVGDIVPVAIEDADEHDLYGVPV